MPMKRKAGNASATISQLGTTYLAADHVGQVVQVTDGTEAPRTWAYSLNGKWISVYTSAIISTDPAPGWNGTASNINMFELGDSFIANGSAAASGYENYGIVTAAMRFSQQRLKRRLDWNFGNGGYTTEQIEGVFNTQVASAVGEAGGFCIFHGGTNDGATLNVDQTLAAMKRIRDALLAMQIPIIFCTPEPRGNDTFPDKRWADTALAYHLERRTRMMAELPATGCVVVDCRAQLLKAGTQNDIIDKYSHDGLHPNPLCCDEVQGPAIAAAIAQLAPASSTLPSGTTARSLNTNVEMTGITTGTTLPTGYTGANASGTTAVTRAYAEVSNTNGRWAQCTLAGGAATSAAAVDIFRQIGLQAKIVVGKTYEIVCEYEISDGAANLLSLQLGFQAVGASGTVTLWDSDRYVEGQKISGLAQRGWFRTPRFTATEALTDFRLRLAAYMSTAGAPAAVIRARNFELRELI